MKNIEVGRDSRTLISSHMNPVTSLGWLFPFFFIGMWLLVCCMLSATSGWKALAAKYPMPATCEGSEIRARGLGMGGCHYNNCVTMIRSESGVGLSMFCLFRLGHPPMFIPWSEIKNARITGSLWWKKVRCDIGGYSDYVISFPVKLFFADGIPMTPVPVAGV